MRTVALALVLSLSACTGEAFRVVPSTNDARAWRQPWVAEEAREHEAFLADQQRQRCDRINWGNFGVSLEERPWECPHPKGTKE